jgi:hypothetical protein
MVVGEASIHAHAGQQQWELVDSNPQPGSKLPYPIDATWPRLEITCTNSLKHWIDDIACSKDEVCMTLIFRRAGLVGLLGLHWLVRAGAQEIRTAASEQSATPAATSVRSPAKDKNAGLVESRAYSDSGCVGTWVSTTRRVQLRK